MLKFILFWGSLILSIGISHAQSVNLIAPGSNWKYLANGSNQGTAWRSTTFNDASWSAGNAELGYGDGDEATVVSYGPNASAKYITTYFRKTFTVNGAASLTNLILRVKRDDGVVVYVNGTQRYKNNLPTGTITYTTKASSSATNDGNTWLSTSLPNGSLLEGNNVIAVEIHQRSATDSDISFNLELNGIQSDVTAPSVTASVPATGSQSIAANAAVLITFSEPVLKGTGEITFTNGNSILQTISINSPDVVVNGNVVTIGHNDFPSGTFHTVNIPTGAFRDAAGNSYAGTGSPSIWNFTTQCYAIGCFTSVQPTAQTNMLVLPSSHSFQIIAKQGQALANGGTFPTNFDFTGYVPIGGSSINGYLSINHENTPAGGNSISNVSYSGTSKLWSRANSLPVDFTPIVKTERNCSGAITPWGTILTGEETRNTGDANSDGYTDTGWLVEIDPVTRQVVQYGTGSPQKCWAMGRMAHENAVVSATDLRTVYYGEDDPTGCVYKFVANSPGNLSSGNLYVLKLNSALSSGNPVTTLGNWVQLPNNTPTERNTTYTLAAGVGATIFNGVEDVEIGPDGKIYFASKGNGRIYRFNDNGTSISNFETFVGGMNYTINYNGGALSEAWGSGNDNLAFDGEGNLWVLQDGGRNHIWLVRNGHTQANPRVELFATTPAGSEPTGITFTPDYKFMFISFQHPNSTNGVQYDASGNAVSINTSSACVIARKEHLGIFPSAMAPDLDNLNNRIQTHVFPVPFKENINLLLTSSLRQKVTIEIFDLAGRNVFHTDLSVYEGTQPMLIPSNNLKGMFVLVVSGEGFNEIHKIVSE